MAGRLEHRVVFIKDGREAESPPMPMEAARHISIMVDGSTATRAVS
jgi:hypothetical protein